MASASREKKSRKRLTLNEKLEVIKLSETGLSNADIGRKLGLARQSVSSIVNDKPKYLEEVKSATPVNCKTIRKRDSLIADMEKYLNIWIEDQTSMHVPLSQSSIQNKALSLFNSMKAERGDSASEETFKASQGWFFRFKERSALHNLLVQGEPDGADKDSVMYMPNLFLKEKRDKLLKAGGKKCKIYDDADELIFKIMNQDSRTSPVTDMLQGSGESSGTDVGHPVEPEVQIVQGDHSAMVNGRLNNSNETISKSRPRLLRQNTEDITDLQRQKLKAEVELVKEKVAIAKRERYKLDLELLKLEKELNVTQPSAFTLPYYMQID